MKNEKIDLVENVEILSMILKEIGKIIEEQNLEEASELLNAAERVLYPIYEERHRLLSIHPRTIYEDSIGGLLQEALDRPKAMNYRKFTTGYVQAIFKSSLEHKADYLINHKEKKNESDNKKEYILDKKEIHRILEQAYPKMLKEAPYGFEVDLHSKNIIYVCILYYKEKKHLCIKYLLPKNRENFIYLKIHEYTKYEIDEVMEYLESFIKKH